MAALDDLTNAGLPIPAIYASETAAADDAYQKALSSIASKQAQLAQQYGFSIQTDPNTGALLDSRIDPNQQFSQVMNLLGAHSAALRNLRESLAGAGLAGGGMKGLAAQRAALLQFQQQGQLAGLGSSFAGQMGDLTNQRAGALSTKNQGYNQAAQDAINFAIQNGWFNQAAPAAPAAPSGGGGGGGGSTPPPSTDPQSLPLPIQSAYDNPGTMAQGFTPSPTMTAQVGNILSGASTPALPTAIQQAFANPGTNVVSKPSTAPIANRSGQTARNSF